MTNPHNIKVGQKLWRVGTAHRSKYGENDYFVEVHKIGRKYGYYRKHYSDVRFNLETLEVDGGGYSSPADLWTNRDAWLEKKERDRLIHRISETFRYPNSVNKRFTSEELREVCYILEIEID